MPGDHATGVPLNRDLEGQRLSKQTLTPMTNLSSADT
jgi:hypothetical protein